MRIELGTVLSHLKNRTLCEKNKISWICVGTCALCTITIDYIDNQYDADHDVACKVAF